MSERALPPRLIALTPGNLHLDPAARALALERAVARGLEGGLRGVLLREPELGDAPLAGLGARLRERLDAVGGWLGLHDRVHLAAHLGADAVHLGFRSLAPGEARSILPGAIAVGFSAHAPDEPASWEGADYLFCGPVRPTPSKEGLLEPIGFEGLGAAARRSALPLWGIGGLRPEDAGPALSAGARGLAVLSGVLGAADPSPAARAYLESLEEAGEGGGRG